MYLLATDLKTKTTFILELARKGSSKINASSMSAIRRETDRSIPLKSVPLYIRRSFKGA